MTVDADRDRGTDTPKDGIPVIYRMPGVEQPEPIGHTRTPDRGAVIDVKTWAQNPHPTCHRCWFCNVLALKSGLYQCMKIELPSTG